MLQQHNLVKVLQNQTLAIPLNTISEYLNPYIENRIPTQRMIILTVQYSTSARPSVFLQIQKYLPAEEDLSQSPTHRHLSGCSVLKYKTNQVFHLIKIPVTGRQQNRKPGGINVFTCFWAAKMTFMKFMYWRAQSSAAFTTYQVI